MLKILSASAMTALLLGCSTKSGSSAATLCSQSVAKKTTNLSSTDSPLELTTSASAFNNASVGIGFLDIDTTSEGVVKSIRCTINIHPSLDDESKFILWTAGHCAFDPRKPEFQTAKYTLRLYQDGGYFNVPIELQYQQSLGKFIQDFENMLKLAPGVPTSVVSEYTSGNWFPEDVTTSCQQSTTEFNSELGPAAKDILCFTEAELRGLTVSATAATAPEIQVRVDSILNTVASRNKAIFEKLPAQSKYLLDFYYKAHIDKIRLANWVRRLGYYLNVNFCAADMATRPQPTTIPRTFNTFCAPLYRGLILEKLKASLPQRLWDIFNTVVTDDKTSLEVLYEKYAMPQEFDISTLSRPIEDVPEDGVAQIAKNIFAQWSEFGFQQLNSLNLRNESLFGFNEETLFTFTNNKPRIATNPLTMKPRTVSLYNPNYQNDIKTKVRKLLVNFDSTQEKLELIKGDSGTMLSLLGGLPFGLLSTVNGEPTSGGASITPLPEVGSEDASKTSSNGKSCP